MSGGRGTLAVSWGPYGGFYLHRRRVCLGWIALTYLPLLEIEELMRAYVERAEMVRGTMGRNDG